MMMMSNDVSATHVSLRRLCSSHLINHSSATSASRTPAKMYNSSCDRSRANCSPEKNEVRIRSWPNGLAIAIAATSKVIQGHRRIARSHHHHHRVLDQRLERAEEF